MQRAARFVFCAILTIVCVPACAQHRSAVSQTVTRGSVIFARECSACHGERGIGGPIGPSLHLESHRRSAAQVEEIVGNPEPPMPKLYPARLSASDVRDVSAYVESL